MKTIDPKDFFDRNWFLTTTGETWPATGKPGDDTKPGNGFKPGSGDRPTTLPRTGV